MAKKTRLKKPSIEDCPVEFVWGTLCEGVYGRGIGRTLVNIQPNRVGVVKIKGKVGKDITVDTGGCDLFAVFRRKPHVSEPIQEKVVITSNIEGGIDTSFGISMQTRHINYYHCSQLPSLPISFKEGAKRFADTYSFKYVWEGHEIGSVPIYLDITLEEGDGKADEQN